MQINHEDTILTFRNDICHMEDIKNWLMTQRKWICVLMEYRLLFHPRFIVPIPSASYHTAANRVDITLISP